MSRIGKALALAVLLSACSLAVPLVAPALQRVLVDAATAQFVGRNCSSLSFDAATARKQIDAVYQRLVAGGTPAEEVEAQTEVFEQEALSDEVAQRLEEGGVNPADPDPENVCAFGETEKEEGSLLGRLLL